MKAGRRLLGEVDALKADCESERTCGAVSFRLVVGRRATAQGEEQGSECCQTQYESADDNAHDGQ